MLNNSNEELPINPPPSPYRFGCGLRSDPPASSFFDLRRPIQPENVRTPVEPEILFSEVTDSFYQNTHLSYTDINNVSPLDFLNTSLNISLDSKIDAMMYRLIEDSKFDIIKVLDEYINYDFSKIYDKFKVHTIEMFEFLISMNAKMPQDFFSLCLKNKRDDFIMVILNGTTDVSDKYSDIYNYAIKSKNIELLNVIKEKRPEILNSDLNSESLEDLKNDYPWLRTLYYSNFIPSISNLKQILNIVSPEMVKMTFDALFMMI